MKSSIFNIKYFLSALIIFISIQWTETFSQNDEWFNPDTIKAGRFDTGKMWMFEHLPTEYFKEEYGFNPGKEWVDHVRLATLKFADYCSASFISSDGLIMTNHHCARESITEIINEDEDLHKDGFIAWTIDDERSVPGLFVEQCIGIEDVTDEIQSAVALAESDSERFVIESEKKQEIESRYQSNDETYAQVTSLYFGGIYSLYIYKRYEDIRLVFAPEFQAGYFGGDYDNFTYPRYNLDCSFFRVYDKNGNPLKTDHYFSWSEEGAQPGEVVFVTGNPGSTSRLKTIAQLEYDKDFTIPQTLDYINGYIEIVEKIIKREPERTNDLSDNLLDYYNSKKAYEGILDGLINPVLIQRKKNFEKTLRKKIQSDPELEKKYGNLWNEIEILMTELGQLMNERKALTYSSFSTPEYFFIADQLIDISEELKLPESERSDIYSDDQLASTIESLIPEDFNYDMNNKLLKDKIDLLYKTYGDDNEIVQEFADGKKGDEAVNDILSRSYLTSKEKLKELAAGGPELILNIEDPFMDFINSADKRDETISSRVGVILSREEICIRKLGNALFEIYGTSIPPDATFTLRISDGVVKGFDYNGTSAPPVTTFYGMLDRYYSFDGKFPWELHERWLNAPSEFDYSTPFNFVTTNDVVGGSSGSPVININAEIVGVSFDGNIQSLPGDFIYEQEVNRSIGLHSAGILEAVRDLYKFDRLAEEIINGRIDE